MNIRFYTFFCTLMASVLLLNSCGFHLRSYPQGQIPRFHALYIQSDVPYTSFDKELRYTLKTLGINTANSPSAAVTLHILSQNFSRTSTSVGNVGQTTTYLLSFTVSFQLIDRQKKISSPVEQIRATRNGSITSNQMSGDLNTQNELQNDMQRDIIQQFITRLSSPALYQQFFQASSR